jgi:hypothetical protein
MEKKTHLSRVKRFQSLLLAVLLGRIKRFQEARIKELEIRHNWRIGCFLGVGESKPNHGYDEREDEDYRQPNPCVDGSPTVVHGSELRLISERHGDQEGRVSSTKPAKDELARITRTKIPEH